MQHEADEVVCATQPQPFFAVGFWYRDFSQTSDDEVRELLREVGQDTGAGAPGLRYPTNRRTA